MYYGIGTTSNHIYNTVVSIKHKKFLIIGCNKKKKKQNEINWFNEHVDINV